MDEPKNPTLEVINAFKPGLKIVDDFLLTDEGEQIVVDTIQKNKGLMVQLT